MDLIENGGCESLEGWLGRPGGLTLASNSGIGGSTAVSETSVRNERDSISQFFDTRCFNGRQGRSYEIRAWVKLIDEAGNPQDCHQDGRGCPEVRLVSSGRTLSNVATIVPQRTTSGDFHLLHGILELDQELARSNIVEFAIRRNRVDYSMQVDDVSVNLMPTLSVGDPLCNENLVYNGNFSSGDAAFWSSSTATMELVDRSADQLAGFSLLLSKGKGQVFVKAGCFEAGEQYEVYIRFKTLQGVQVTVCDQISGGGVECPSAKLLTFRDLAFFGGERIAEALDTLPGAESSVLFGVFTATTQHVQADRMILELDNLNDEYEYLVESVSIQLKPKECNKNILVNSNMEMGVKQFWVSVGPGTVEWTREGYDTSSSGALLSGGREYPNNGPKYNAEGFLDVRCLVPGSKWEVKAQIKVLDAKTGAPTVCNADSSDSSDSEDACPSVRVVIKDAAENQVLDVYLMEYVEILSDVDGWNEFHATLTLPVSDVWDGSVSSGGVLIHIRSFPVGMAVVVDDFVVRVVG